MSAFLDRALAAIRPAPAPNPLTIRLRHVDMDLERLAAQRPRTVAVLAAIDFRLDERLQLRPADGEVSRG